MGGGWLRQGRLEDGYVKKKSTYLVVLCRTCRKEAGSCALVGCEETSVGYFCTPDDGHNDAQNMLS
jgi:surface antigen